MILSFKKTQFAKIKIRLNGREYFRIEMLKKRKSKK